jgi:hypothetical protein
MGQVPPPHQVFHVGPNYYSTPHLEAEFEPQHKGHSNGAKLSRDQRMRGKCQGRVLVFEIWSAYGSYVRKNSNDCHGPRTEGWIKIGIIYRS